MSALRGIGGSGDILSQLPSYAVRQRNSPTVTPWRSSVSKWWQIVAHCAGKHGIVRSL